MEMVFPKNQPNKELINGNAFQPLQAGIFNVERAAAGGNFGDFPARYRWNTLKNHRIWFPQTKKFPPAASKIITTFIKLHIGETIQTEC